MLCEGNRAGVLAKRFGVWHEIIAIETLLQFSLKLLVTRQVARGRQRAMSDPPNQPSKAPEASQEDAAAAWRAQRTQKSCLHSDKPAEASSDGKWHPLEATWRVCTLPFKVLIVHSTYICRWLFVITPQAYGMQYMEISRSRHRRKCDSSERFMQPARISIISRSSRLSARSGQ